MPGEAIAADDVLPEEFFDWGGAHVDEWLCFYPFCKIFNYDHCEGVIALCGSQLSNDVDAPPL
jgi:hypothetical protein